MKIFLNGYFHEIYGRELIDKTNLSQKNIALTLKELESKGILKCLSSGNRKHYSINFSNPLINSYLVLFEDLRKIDFLEKHKKLVDFANEVEGDIVCVFGSYAKGTFTKKSDLDLLVVGKADSLKIKKLGKEFGFNVQVFHMTFSDFEKQVEKKSVLILEVLENHVIFKGGDKFVEKFNG